MSRTPRLELAVEIVLLVSGVAYLVVMLGYPRNAGIVPSIAAAVMIGAVVLQMGRRLISSRSSAARPAHDEETDPKAFDGLIGEAGMDAGAKRRVMTAVVWTIAAVFCVQLIGFVLGAVLAVAAFLLIARQPVLIVAGTTAVVGVGVYALTDLILGIPWTTAPLLEELLR